MKRIKSKLLTGVVVTSVVCVLMSFTLVKLHERSMRYSVTKSQKQEIISETKSMDIESIVDYSLSYTAKTLEFSTVNRLDRGKANCVGYASFCASVCNTAIEARNLDGKAKPVVGYIKAANINLCRLAEGICTKREYKNFVKDHDFVELKTHSTIYQFDPCLYDMIGMSCLSKQRRE